MDGENRWFEFSEKSLFCEERIETVDGKDAIASPGKFRPHGQPNRFELRRRFRHINRLTLVAHLTQDIPEALSQTIHFIIKLRFSGAKLVEAVIRGAKEIEAIGRF